MFESTVFVPTAAVGAVVDVGYQFALAGIVDASNSPGRIVVVGEDPVGLGSLFTVSVLSKWSLR